MGSRTDVAEVIGACRWSEEGSYLAEVVKAGFPQIVRITRGQYCHVGYPTFANPSLISHLLLLSGGKNVSVAAQCVKFKSSRSKVVPFGPTLAIPQGFQGHFEILNEDGKCASSILTVADLARKLPELFLVREAVKGYKPVSSESNGIYQNKSSGSDASAASGSSDQSLPPPGLTLPGPRGGHAPMVHRVSDKTRTLQPGETLSLTSEVTVPLGKSKYARYLHCIDSKGESIYLSLSQKGKFSALAREESISGVHTTKNILSKRMPLMVRLVDGTHPATHYGKSSFKFVPELRLFSLIQEDHLIFCMPLSQNSKEGRLLPLPLSVPLKFTVAKNLRDVEGMKQYGRILDKAKSQVLHIKNLIQIYDINLKRELRFDGRQWKSYTPPIFLSTNPIPDSTEPSSKDSDTYEIPELLDYEEIDQIYDFVRGIKPPPHRKELLSSGNNGNSSISIMKPKEKSPGKVKSPLEGSLLKNNPSQTEDCHKRAISNAEKRLSNAEDTPPEPPPIETIPTHRGRFGEIEKKPSWNKRRGSGGVQGHVALHKMHSSSRENLISTNTSGGTGSSGSGGRGGQGLERRPHLYVKKGGEHGVLSGSPSNRLIFRRSPIFDCRYKSTNVYKSMNDLNRNSLESSGSGGSRGSYSASPMSRLFHSGHHHQSQGPLQLPHITNLNLKSSSKHPKIFRPKSLTNIVSCDGVQQLELLQSKKMVVPSHVHSVSVHQRRSRGSLAAPPTTLFL